MLTARQLETECSGVRFASPADEEGLVQMVRVMHSDPDWGLFDSEGRSYVFSEERTRATVQRAILPNRNHPDSATSWIGVMGSVGDLQGSACVCVQYLSMSEGAYMAEVWSYVLPEHRNSIAADALSRFVMAMADACGMVLLSATMTRARTSKSRFYERRFGPAVAAIHRYVPQGD